MGQLKTGSACADMDLQIGMDLTGYLGRTSASSGIHDRLKLKCFVFSEGGSAIVFVSCSLLGLSSDFVKETNRLIEERTGVPADRIIIACTHTHSGPASIFLQDCGEQREEWMEALKYKIADCAESAMKNLKPSSVAFKTGKCEIALNRVRKGLMAQSAIHKAGDGTGQGEIDTDPGVGVMVITDESTGLPDTLIVNYACHPVVLGKENLLYSGDFPYYMEEKIKAVFGEKIKVVFMNGCCGDLNPVKRGGFDMTRLVGEELAESVIGIVNNGFCTNTAGDSPIKLDTLRVEIPLSHQLDRLKILELKGEYLRNLEEEKDDEQKVVYRAYANWAEKMLVELEKGLLPCSVEAEIKIAVIGGTVIVTLPFEVFHGIGLRLKEHFGKERSMVLCYANGDYGYLPSRELYDLSGYEVNGAYKFYGYPGPVCREAEEIILNAISEYSQGR